MPETPLIDVRPEHWMIVRDILRHHVPKYEVWAFGSRAKWLAKQYSDLDLAIITDTPLSLEVLAALSDDFTESDLPWKVDVVDWATTSETFRAIIERDKVVVQDEVANEGEFIFPIHANWEATTLGKVCQRGGGNIQTGPFGSQLHASDYVQFGIPSIMPQNIGDNRINENGIARITPQDAQRLSRYLVKEGDIIYSRRGDVERRSLIRQHESGWLCGTGCLRIRFGGGVVDPIYASYYLGHPLVREWIVRHAHGATMPNLNTSILSSLPFIIPPLSEQRAIAHILGTLDDKIELNRKSNETLEAIAKALFKSWFVDFDPVRAKMEGRPTGLPDDISNLFPDSFEEPGLGLRPQNWGTGSFLQQANVLGGGTPKTIEASFWNGTIPWFSVVDAPQGSDSWVIDTEKKITRKGLDNCASRLLRKGTTILTARGTVGKVCLVGTDMAMNQSCYALQAQATRGDTFIFFLTKSIVDLLEARAHGSVFNTITRDTLAGIDTIIPPANVIEAFEGIAESVMEKIRANLEQSHNLSSIRDSLLPKLISGDLRIPDAEVFLEAAGV